jgi:hypothetical protein
MSHQHTFADSEFNGKRRKTRKEVFLARMEAVLPWPRMLGVIEPIYPKAGNGRRPYPLDAMLRIYCMQPWYSLSDIEPADVKAEWAIAMCPGKLKELKKAPSSKQGGDCI